MPLRRREGRESSPLTLALSRRGKEKFEASLHVMPARAGGPGAPVARLGIPSNRPLPPGGFGLLHSQVW